MDLTQTLNAQLAMVIFFALMPILAMMQARRAQRTKIKVFMPEDDTRRDETIRPRGNV